MRQHIKQWIAFTLEHIMTNLGAAFRTGGLLMEHHMIITFLYLVKVLHQIKSCLAAAK